MSEPRAGAEIIPFPRHLRVVALGDEPRPEPEAPPASGPQLVEHDGRVYPLTNLLQRLSPDELREVEGSVPRTGQEVWDEVVRRWPAMAKEIAAGVSPVG